MDFESLLPGTRIGDVVVTRVLGAGGFGTVYEGRDVVLDRLVAVKVVEGGGIDDAERGRLLIEARALARLQSPHVVVIHRVEAIGDGRLALEMEHVAGGSLVEVLGDDDGPAADTARTLSPKRAVELARGVAKALASVHRAGVVHGDLKPENVLRTLDGDIKLVDFGLAHMFAERRLEATGSAGGSPPYMAPEVISDSERTPRSDVWSFGVLLHRMLTGRLPFAGTTLAALFFAILEDPPPPMGAGVPSPLARLVGVCLSKAPADRPDSATLDALLVRSLEPEAPRASTDSPTRGALAGPDPLPPTAPSALFARETELGSLRAAFDAITSGSGTTVLVTGEVGIGKTAIVRAARSMAAARDVGWIEIALTPSVGLLRPLLSALRRTLARRGERATERVEVTSGEFGPAVGALRAVLRDERRPGVESTGEATFAIERLLAALARRRPVVLAVEGLHAAERGEIVILRDLARRLREHRVLLLFSARVAPSDDGRGSGPLAAFAELESVVRMPLAPFRREALYGLLELAAGAPIDPDAARPLVDRADGNPLLALELLRHARANGTIVTSSLGLRSAEVNRPSQLPARLVDLFAARVDALSRPDRELLEVAAVDGPSFDGPALAAALGRPLLTVLRQLQRLSRETGIVVPHEAAFQFVHVLLREILVDRVGLALRREIHASLARHLESRGDDVDPERIGTHFESSGDVSRAIPFLREAVREAALRSERERVVALLPRARLRPEDIDVDVACRYPDTLMYVARAYSSLGAHEASAEAIYSLLADPAVAAADPTIPLRVDVRRSHQRFFAEGVRAIDEHALRRAAGELPPSTDQSRALYLLGVVAKFRGDLAGARDQLMQSLGVLDRIVGPLSYRAAAIDQLASIELREGRPGVAMRRYAEAAELAEQAGAHHNAAVSRVNGVLAALVVGELDGQEDILDAAIRSLELEGARAQAGHALVVRARLLYAAGATDRATSCLEGALRRKDVVAYRPAAIAARIDLGHLAIVVGDAARAGALLREAQADASALSDGASLLRIAALECQRGCLAGDAGPGSDAETAFLGLLGCAGDPQARTDACALAMESSLFGASPAFAKLVGERLAAAEEGSGTAPVRCLVERASAFAAFRDESAGPKPLDDLAATLELGPRSERPATLEIIADLVAGEAATRRRSPLDASARLERGLARARALRHALLIRTFEERLLRLGKPTSAGA